MGLTPQEKAALNYCWPFWARTDQLPPAWDWFIWLILSGRGWGKTRTGAEAVIQWHKQGFEHISLAGRTTGDVRDIMIEGESGIRAKCPNYLLPKYITSKRQMVWPNGAVSKVFTSDEPDGTRGHQHEKIWADELAAWIDLQTWDHLLMGLRIGSCPQVIVTTTPRRMKLLRELLRDKGTAVTRGHTLENQANLAESTVRMLVEKYGGTELGRQELGGEILDDRDGAYWTQDQIDATRRIEHPALTRIVIGVDPAITRSKRADATGIVIVGRATDGDLYVLEDLSDKYSPSGWADATIAAYERWGAKLIVAESNRGGDIIEHTLREAAAKRGVLPTIETLNSQEDKGGRAEPVSAMYSKSKVHHVGIHKELEEEMVDWDPAVSKYSPNRIDALVFACVSLSPNRGPISPSGTIVRRIAERKLLR